MAVRAASTSTSGRKAIPASAGVLYSFTQFGRGEKVRSERIFGIFWEACMRNVTSDHEDLPVLGGILVYAQLKEEGAYAPASIF
jgi:hypothetical protein